MRVVVALGGNALLKRGEPMTAEVQRGNVKVAAQALAPVAPHVGEELWQIAGGEGSVFRSGWLTWDSAALQEDVVTVVVQVDGKLRAQLSLARGASRDQVEAAARSDERVQRAVVSARGDISELQATVQAMRDELERQRIEYEQRLQTAEREALAEKTQLRQAIQVLRDQLEKGDA